MLQNDNDSYDYLMMMAGDGSGQGLGGINRRVTKGNTPRASSPIYDMPMQPAQPSSQQDDQGLMGGGIDPSMLLQLAAAGNGGAAGQGGLASEGEFGGQYSNSSVAATQPSMRPGAQFSPRLASSQPAPAGTFSPTTPSQGGGGFGADPLTMMLLSQFMGG